MDLKKIIKSIGMIACIIILCTVIVKYTIPNETLLDYANENPELAYASPEASALIRTLKLRISLLLKKLMEIKQTVKVLSMPKIPMQKIPM